MSLETKATFLSELEHQLSTSVTAADMARVLTLVSDTLQRYDLTRSADADDAGSYDLFEAYISALKIQGRSPKTIERYRYVIGRLLEDLKTPIRSITVYHIRSWLSRESARGIADSSLESERLVFSGFFGWLFREQLIDRNPMSNIGAIKIQKKVKEAYTNVDIEKLRTACSDTRNMAILNLLMSTGCRISEVTQLNRTDIDFQNNEIVVLGKGNKERTVFFDDVTALHLHHYLATRSDMNPALFINRFGKRIEPGGIRFMLKELARAAGVEHVHPHKFRRTLATTLIAHGMPIQEVAAILGHDKLDTTMRYVVLDKSATKASYKKYA